MKKVKEKKKLSEIIKDNENLHTIDKILLNGNKEKYLKDFYNYIMNIHYLEKDIDKIIKDFAKNYKN